MCQRLRTWLGKKALDVLLPETRAFLYESVHAAHIQDACIKLLLYCKHGRGVRLCGMQTAAANTRIPEK